jgi:peroxiredoxin
MTRNVCNVRARQLWRVIAEGSEAPDFELEDQDGNRVKLSELRGSPVVLYFYPKADTYGRTDGHYRCEGDRRPTLCDTGRRSEVMVS